MRILAIETASEACSVALYEDAQRIAHDHRELGRGHAERLVPMIEALPEKGRADRILVSLGPGSFTGIRIGIATARALGVAWQAEVLGYPTLALVAKCGQHSSPKPVTVCMNGGHGEWFVGDFAPDKTLGEVRSLTPQAALERGAQQVIKGNRAKELAEALGEEHTAFNLLPDSGAVHLLEEVWLTRDLTPIYGRAPDATPQAAGGGKPA